MHFLVKSYYLVIVIFIGRLFDVEVSVIDIEGSQPSPQAGQHKQSN